MEKVKDRAGKTVPSGGYEDNGLVQIAEWIVGSLR